MNTRRLLALILILGLLAPTAGAAAPLAGPCTPGAVYDPACDVDHDGDVDIFDIQLTAGHWNRRGTWVSDNGHDHLGQIWTGNNNRLAIQGSFGIPAVAPLVLTNSGPGDGLWITGAGFSGVTVSSAGTDGVYVARAGDPLTQNSSSLRNGFEVAAAEHNGLYVGVAEDSGVYVNYAADMGVQVNSADDAGVYVGNAGGAGIYVDSATTGITVHDVIGTGIRVDLAGGDGVYVAVAGDPTGAAVSGASNGVEVAAAEGHGLFIGRANQSGVYVSRADQFGVYVDEAPVAGVYADTNDVLGEWGVFTPDKIYGSNISLSSVTIIAQVAGEQALSPGDVVAASGVAAPLPGSTVSLALVRLADAASPHGIVGVVEGHMALTPQPGHEEGTGRDPVLEVRRAAGAAQPGDYVALTVLGVALVKVEAGAAIEPGQRLVASTAPGRARALRTVDVDGVRLAEDAPSIGVALAAPAPSQDAIPVFVTLR